MVLKMINLFLRMRTSPCFFSGTGYFPKILMYACLLFPSAVYGSVRASADDGASFAVQSVLDVYAAEEPEVHDGMIEGRVSDDAGPMQGVMVYVKGTQKGTMTDENGYYSLSGLAEGDVLVFSMMGYEELEIRYDGKHLHNVKMSPEAISINRVVVTALGIKRNEAALSYNVQEINSDRINKVKSANFVTSLAGKVAGVQISSGAGGSGSSSRVVMRGNKSIERSNTALYVIDGIPMYNRVVGGGGGVYGGSIGTESAADINPEDIESISMLTGPSAAALYGSDAANGVIIINTKKGSAERTSVTVGSATDFSMVYMVPEIQNRYGGEGLMNWGEATDMRFDLMDFFKTSYNTINSFSISTGNSRNQTYASVSATNSDAVIPQTRYDRYNLTVRNTSSFFGDRLEMDLSGGYVYQTDRNMVSQGNYNNPLPSLYLFPRADDFSEIKNFERMDESLGYMVQYWPYGNGQHSLQNPYWIQNRMVRQTEKNRYMINASLKYNITDWLNITARARVDNSVYRTRNMNYASTLTTFCGDNGGYQDIMQDDRSVYGDVMLNMNKEWGKWSLNAVAGASLNDVRSYNQGIKGDLVIPNYFAVNNLDMEKNLLPSQGGWHDQTQSVFASVEAGWNRGIYITATGRNDWASQLAFTSTPCFFYPSLGVSVVLSNLVKMPSWMNTVKFRGSYSEVATAFSRYLSNPSLEYDSSTHTWKQPSTYPLRNLKPENTRSWEAGFLLNLFDMFTVDATFYHSNTYNQIIYAPMAESTGYSRFIAQTGNIMNRGIELSLDFFNSWGGFSWDSRFNYTINENRIIELAHGIPDPVTGKPVDVTEIQKSWLGAANVAPRVILREGGSLSDIYVNHKVVQGDDGSLKVVDTGYEKVGQMAPRYNLGWSNTFSYAGLSLSVVVTARIGGLVYSATQGILDYYGGSEVTADARENGGVDFLGKRYDAMTYYQTVATADGGHGRYYLYDATNVRLQELSLSYTLPRKWFSGKANITLGITGRNLFMFYCKAPFDPDMSSAVGDNYYQGVDYFMMPSTRSVGFNIKVRF